MPRNLKMKWLCPERDGGSQGGGNIVSNLFGGRRSINTGTFVREDLQNHVDAKDPAVRGPVHVRYTFQELPGELIDRYLPGLFREHIMNAELRRLSGARREQVRDELEGVFASDTLPVLVVEDFATIGLNGPVNSNFAEQNENHSLYHPDNALTCFFQRSGESGKTGEKLGSVGLGRHVYYMTSRIHTKFIYTLPVDSCWKRTDGLEEIEPRPLFFGQSCQNERQIIRDGEEICFENYLSLSPGREYEDNTLSPYLPFGLRSGEADIVERARTDFGLGREPDQAGTSIIIPFPRDNVKPRSLVDAVAKHFAVPVLDGRLKIEVNGILIDQDSIIDISSEAQVNARNTFIVEALTAPPGAQICVSPEGLNERLGKQCFPEGAHNK